MLCGLLFPSCGTVSVGGFDLKANGDEARRLIAYVPDLPFLYEKLTGRAFGEPGDAEGVSILATDASINGCPVPPGARGCGRGQIRDQGGNELAMSTVPHDRFGLGANHPPADETPAPGRLRAYASSMRRDITPDAEAERLPEAAVTVASDAIHLLTEYQGTDYARLYVERLKRFVGKRGSELVVIRDLALHQRVRYIDSKLFVDVRPHIGVLVNLTFRRSSTGENE